MKKLLIVLLISIQCYGSRSILEDMLPHIAIVESSGGLSTTGDNGRAIGHLQIWKIVVDDVNRVYKTSYTYQDRNSVVKSEEMYFKYLSFWGKRYKINTGLDPTEEVYSRIWSGGPQGYKRKGTLRYYKRYLEVKNAIGYTLKSKRELMERLIAFKYKKSKYC